MVKSLEYKKPRGRPRKAGGTTLVWCPYRGIWRLPNVHDTHKPTIVKRPRGRPRIHPKVESAKEKAARLLEEKRKCIEQERIRQDKLAAECAIKHAQRLLSEIERENFPIKTTLTVLGVSVLGYNLVLEESGGDDESDDESDMMKIINSSIERRRKFSNGVW